MVGNPQIIRQFDSVKSVRYNYETEWQKISEVLDPESRAFTVTNTNGYVSRRKIYDSTPERSVDDLTSSLMSMLAMPNKQWGVLTLENPEVEQTRDIKKDLQVATKKVLAHLARPVTNFYNSQADCLFDFAVYGQGYTYMYPDTAKKVVRFANIPTQECYAQRDAYGDLTAWYRELVMTPLEVMNTFFDSKYCQYSSEDKRYIKECIQKDPTKENCLVHAIISKEEAKAIGVPYQDNRPWVQVFADIDKKRVLHVDFLKRFPVLAPSWTRKSKSPYGRGPGHKALPEIDTLNAMIKTNLTGGQLMVQPSMWTPYEMVQSGVLDLSPGANNLYSISDAMTSTGIVKPEALHIVKDLSFPMEMEMFRRQQISQIFYSDLLQEFKNAEMSATESQVRETARSRKMSGPLARYEAENLDRAFVFTFGYLSDWGIIKMSSSIKDKDVMVSFRSGLYESYTMGKLQLLERATQALANLKGIPPELSPNFNPEKLLEYVFEHAGADMSVLEDPAVADEKREQAAQLEQSQAAASQAQAVNQLSQAFGGALGA